MKFLSSTCVQTNKKFIRLKQIPFAVEDERSALGGRVES